MSDEPKSQLLLYQAPDGRTRLEARMQGETVWLTQAQMAELFPEATRKESLSVQPKGQVQPSATAREFLIFRQEGCPARNSVCADSAHTAADGKTYQTEGTA